MAQAMYISSSSSNLIDDLIVLMRKSIEIVPYPPSSLVDAPVLVGTVESVTSYRSSICASSFDVSAAVISDFIGDCARTPVDVAVAL